MHVLDVPIDLGAHNEITVEWLDADGNAVVLTGATARAHFRATRDAAATLLELTDAGGSIVLADGSVTLIITAAASAALASVPRGVYDVEVTIGGEPFRPFGGRFLPSVGVTR